MFFSRRKILMLHIWALWACFLSHKTLHAKLRYLSHFFAAQFLLLLFFFFFVCSSYARCAHLFYWQNSYSFGRKLQACYPRAHIIVIEELRSMCWAVRLSFTHMSYMICDDGLRSISFILDDVSLFGLCVCKCFVVSHILPFIWILFVHLWWGSHLETEQP